MVLDLVLKAFFSVVDLLRGSFLLSIPAFVLVFLASFFHAWLSKKYGFSWLKATMITSYLAIFILIMLLYFTPVISGYGESDQGIVPSIFQTTALESAIFFFLLVLRNAVIALLFAFFVLPLEFLSSSVFDYLNEKAKLGKWINIFVAVFAACLATAIITLFLLPWIVPGLIYLVFYWHL